MPLLSLARGAVRDLDPGYFGLVMATGIVSEAVRRDGAGTLSVLLLAVAAAAYLVLAAASSWRLLAWRADLLADAAHPGRFPGFFTFVAASDVLAARLMAGGQRGAGAAAAAAVALLAVAAAGWLLLSYAAPAVLASWTGPPPLLATANGTWFLWPVATASIAVAAESMPPGGRPVRAAVAVTCWAIAVVLYVVTATAVTCSLVRYRRTPAEVTPPYWIFMGATAICVLAGALLLRLPPGPVTTAVRGVVPGVSLALWSFGTCLIPFLIAAGVWRHLLHKVPLRYEPGLWSIVFPLGMHATATAELGVALRIGWLVTWGGAEAWFALAAWTAVALAPARRLLPRLRSAGGAQPGQQAGPHTGPGRKR